MEFSVETRDKDEFIDITDKVQEMIDIEEGWCLVYCPHTTAGLTINEGADPAVKSDILAALKRLVADDVSYKHAEGNSPGHIKSSLTGSSLTIPVKGGSLLLGTWQSIYFCEFDGPRKRRTVVSFIKG